MKTIVTMTSWTKRILFVAKSIEYFLNTQTVKPDIFYLWLAEEEFPNRENELPKDLLEIITKYKVSLKWLKKNTFCHKRWEVYPKHLQDLVISIDDDVLYNPNLIAECKRQAELYPDKIFCHVKEWVAIPVYNNTIHYQRWVYTHDRNLFNRLFFCGQCAFPPNTFPVLALNDIEDRDRICPVCDEAWIIANLLAEGRYPVSIEPDVNLAPGVLSNTQDVGIVNTYNAEYLHNKNYTKKDLGIYKALEFRNVLDKWRELHPDYGTL